MGTSGSSSGSGSNTPLVPSWLDDGGDLNGPNDADAQTEPYLSPETPPRRFQSARTNFSRFARSGGSDTRALQRAVRDYVLSGTRGSNNATRRMGKSRTAASEVLRIFGSFQREGVLETLRPFNLEHLSGREVQEVFIGLTEIICPDGGLIDEAIARGAWLETIADLGNFGIENLDALSSDQVGQVFLSFIAHSIETHLYQEIGVNGFKFAENLEGIDSLDRQLREYIERSVRDSFQGDLTNLSGMTSQDVERIVGNTYRDVWDLLQACGGNEE